LRRDDGLRAGRQRRDRIDEKAVRGVDRLVAVLEIGAGDQVEQIVGAGAADDARRIEAERLTDRLAQRGRGAVRIILEVLAGLVVGGDRMRARAQRRLVGRELEHLGDAGRAALARDVRGNVEHAGARLRTVGHGRIRTFQALSAATVERVAWLPTRAAERKVAPALTRVALMTSSELLLGRLMSSAAPSKARS